MILKRSCSHVWACECSQLNVHYTVSLSHLQREVRKVPLLDECHSEPFLVELNRQYLVNVKCAIYIVNIVMASDLSRLIFIEIHMTGVKTVLQRYWHNKSMWLYRNGLLRVLDAELRIEIIDPHKDTLPYTYALRRNVFLSITELPVARQGQHTICKLQLTIVWLSEKLCSADMMSTEFECEKYLIC